MARTVGGGTPVVIAVPAHWGQGTVDALRGALAATPSLAPGGVPPALVPDSVAALSALQAAPGLPPNGVVVLCDFGGSGTSITLADAASGFTTIGETVRYADFSGDQIDQALLNHVIAGIADAGNSDPASTAAVGSLARLRNDCRLAKEQLSAETAAAVHVDLPGYASDVRVTRNELEQLIARAPGRGAQCRRRDVAAQQHSGYQRLRSGDCRWRREHPAGHPAAVHSAAGTRRHHSAVTVQRRGGCRADGGHRRGGDRYGPCGGYAHRHGARPRPAGRRAPPAWLQAPPERQPPHRLPTLRIRRRFGRWRGHRTTRRPANPCPTPARTTPSNKARRVRFARRWSSATKKRTTRRSRGRCPGTSGPRFCSGRPRRRCCWPSAGSQSP